MILACQKLLGQITKVLGFGENLPPCMGKTPKKSRIFFLTGSLIVAPVNQWVSEWVNHSFKFPNIVAIAIFIDIALAIAKAIVIAIAVVKLF